MWLRACSRLCTPLFDPLSPVHTSLELPATEVGIYQGTILHYWLCRDLNRRQLHARCCIRLFLLQPVLHFDLVGTIPSLQVTRWSGQEQSTVRQGK